MHSGNDSAGFDSPQDLSLPSRTATAPHRTAARPHRSESELGDRVAIAPLRLWVLGIVALAGAGLSGYLGWASYSGSEVAGCDGGLFDCNHVLTSRWSKVLGIPVGIPATLLYGGLLLATIALRMGPRRWQSKCWIAIALISLVAALAAAWFVSLQVFAVGQLCWYCLLAHGCGLIAAAVVWWRPQLSHSTRVKLAAPAVLAVGGLIAIQAFTPPPPTFRTDANEDIVPAGEIEAEFPDGEFAAPGQS